MALFGATGTAGQGAAAALVAAGHSVTAFGRSDPARDGVRFTPLNVTRPVPPGTFVAQGIDTVVSCLSARSGLPADAWAIDHAAHLCILNAARAEGVTLFVHLSAICLQKPRLPFQHAKLAFEAELTASGLGYAIVRPTAFFKSLSGQVARVQRGKPYLIVGDGRLTACKPISDRDLGVYIAACLTDPARHNRTLPIGGPGPALTPRDMGHMIFKLTGGPPRFRSLPPALLRGIGTGLRIGGTINAKLADKAQLARIGHYYATQSMLVWDPDQQRYDAEATPETGHDTIQDHYAALLDGCTRHDLGQHAVF